MQVHCAPVRGKVMDDETGGIGEEWAMRKFSNLLELREWLDNFKDSELEVTGFHDGQTLHVRAYEHQLTNLSVATDCICYLK